MKTTRRIKCQEPGCGEYAHYTYDTRAEAREADLRRVKYPWKCTRHSEPERMMGLDRLETEITMVATRAAGLDPGKYRFWHDGKRLGSGFSFGPSHKAFATDFPEGTKLIVTARIVLPPETH